jgi:predicted AAA+ superfamily ATPase
MVNNLAKEALLAVVADWLSGKDLPAMVPRERLNVDPTGLTRILAIVGPRRSGKTYCMYQLIERLFRETGADRRDVLLVDFEDYRLTGFSDNDTAGLLEAFNQLAGRDPQYLFLDEVQHIPGWSRVVRTLHNTGRFRIVVSGSNSRLLQEEVATELRGRYEDLLVLPFSFREYLRCREIPYDPASLHTSARGRVVAAFEEYAGCGGFPEVVLARDHAERLGLLQNYFRTIFYRDLLERHNIRARHLLEALMAEMLESYASVFSISRYEKALKGSGLPGSKRTVANYLHHLQESFFVIANEKFSPSPRRRAMNPRKVYLLDTGFASLGRALSENRGRVLENVVAAELCRGQKETYYFKGRRECDFVLKEGTRPVTGLQVCAELRPENETRELGALVEATEALKLSRGMVLTWDQERTIKHHGHEIDVIPAWKWLLGEPVA